MLRIYYERKDRGLSQASLGTLAHIAQSDIGVIECGRLIPTPAQLDRLAKALNLPADVLLKPVQIIDGPMRLNHQLNAQIRVARLRAEVASLEAEVEAAQRAELEAAQ